jgi:hypothetical protein
VKFIVYIDLGEEFEIAKNIAAIIQARQDSQQNTLSVEEFAAISDLNKICVLIFYE